MVSGWDFSSRIWQTVLTYSSAMLEEYQEVTSIHIYSLAPRPQSDVALLADVANSVSEMYKKGEPLLDASKFGIISNPSVRRRDPKGRPASLTVSSSGTAKQEKGPEKPAPVARTKQDATGKPTTDTAPPSSTGKVATPMAKRGGAGGILQSFAKAASIPPAKPKPAIDEEETSAAALSDDGEADDSDVPSAKKTSTTPDATKKSRKEREESLRRMMEEENDSDEESDIEEMGDAPELEPEPEPEPELEPEQPASDTKPEENEPAEVFSKSENGRRRGKRRVMKKKRILDDQGYMGELPLPPPFFNTRASSMKASSHSGAQSPYKSLAGSLSPKTMLLSHQRRRQLPIRPRRLRRGKRRSLLAKKTKAILCHSSQRSRTFLFVCVARGRTGIGQIRRRTTAIVLYETHFLALRSKPPHELDALSSKYALLSCI